MEAGRGGHGENSREADPEKVAAMIASMKADAARAVSQQQPASKAEGNAAYRAPSKTKGSAPAAAAVVAAGAANEKGKAEDSAHERDDNSESTVSEESQNRLGGRQRSGSIEEIRGSHQGGDPRAAEEQQRYLDKGKGKMTQGRRTDSASSLRYGHVSKA